MSETKDIIQWHNGFVPAMELDFREDRHLLTFLKEHNLNAMPNRIDLLIIRKESKAILKNDIGKIFRGHNITDYKSPDDALNMDTLYKTYGYAYLYKAYEKYKNEIGIDDNARSVFDIIYHANRRLFLGHKEGDRMYAVVKDLFLTEYAQGIIETARKFNASDDVVVSILSEQAEVEVDEAERLLEEYDSKPVTV